MIRPLFARIQIYPDESLLSIIARSADANVVPNTATLLKRVIPDAGRTCSTPFTQIENAEALSEFLGLSRTEVHSRMFPTLFGSKKDTINWFGTPLKRRFIEIGARRYSNEALKILPYGRSSWLIKPLLYCPETFEKLQSCCPYCGVELGWRRTAGIGVCEHCDTQLAQSDGRLPNAHHEAFRQIAGLVDVRPETRRASVALLPPPFNCWEPGDIFGAAVELAALASEAENSEGADGRTIAPEDCRSKGQPSILLGWNLLRNWPNALDEMVYSILNIRKNNQGKNDIFGPLSALCENKSKSKIANFVQDKVSMACRDLNLTLKFMPKSKALCVSRKTSVSMWDAASEFHIGSNLLRRLAREGECLVGRSRGTTGICLFDRAKLQRAVSLRNSGVSASEFSKVVGIPIYAVPAMVDAGIVRQICDQTVRVMTDGILLDPISVNSFYCALADLKAPSHTQPLAQMSHILRSDLSPHVWPIIFSRILSGELHAAVEDSEGRWSDRILLENKALDECLRKVRSEPLPDIGVAACVAAQIVNFSDITLGQAVATGLIQKGPNGIPLSGLAKFRVDYVSPKEVSEWFDGSRHSFTKTMFVSGAIPVATLHKVNIWRRSDVERVFGCQRTRNAWWIGAPVAEL